jgi:hypothetical protein
MTDKTSVAPLCLLELPAIPPFPGVCPRDAIRDPCMVLGAPANPGMVAVEAFQTLRVEAKDDDATSVVSPVNIPGIPGGECPKAALRTGDCSEEEGDSECGEGDGWTTDEDAEKLRETAKYDAEIYRELGAYVCTVCTETDLCTDAPPTGRDLFPAVVVAEPAKMRRRPKRGCVVCWEITRNHCGRCRSVRYCSKECQAEAWPLHKAHCNHYRYLKRYLLPEVVD